MSIPSEISNDSEADSPAVVYFDINLEGAISWVTLRTMSTEALQRTHADIATELEQRYHEAKRKQREQKHEGQQDQTLGESK